jgi:hypothetical protein
MSVLRRSKEFPQILWAGALHQVQPRRWRRNWWIAPAAACDGRRETSGPKSAAPHHLPECLYTTSYLMTWGITGRWGRVIGGRLLSKPPNPPHII